MNENDFTQKLWSAMSKLCQQDLETAISDFFSECRELFPIARIYLGTRDFENNKTLIISSTDATGTRRIFEEISFTKKQLEHIEKTNFTDKSTRESILVESEDSIYAPIFQFTNAPISYPFYVSRRSAADGYINGAIFVFEESYHLTDMDKYIADSLHWPLKIFATTWYQYWKLENLKEELHKDNREIRQQIMGIKSIDVIGVNGGLKDVFAQIKQIAPLDITILVTGETGTGKEIIAKSIHEISNKKAKKFLAVNCAAIPATLIDSQLFGHAKGSFTGAHAPHKGFFEQAQEGTLFLDEIAELPLEIQAKLLRVLQEKVITPIGAEKSIPVDFRLIAATNKNLEKMVAEGSFRQDLLYRIQVIDIAIPPLRERTQDILPLTQYFVKKAAIRFAITAPNIPQEEYAKLLNYRWPGNVRELQNIVEEAMAYSKYGCINFWPFKENIENTSTLQKASTFPTYKQYVKSYLQKVLEISSGKIRGRHGAADLTGLNYSTLRSKLKKHEILYDKGSGEASGEA